MSAASKPGATAAAGETSLDATKRVLFVTSAMDDVPSGGRALLSHLLRDALGVLPGVQSSTFEVQPCPLRGWQSISAVFSGHIDGVSRHVMRQLVAKVRNTGIDTVFLDGSNFGALARALKRECPGVEVMGFFHNCEARFFLGSLRQHPSIRAFGVLVANYRAERLTVQSSDKLICLSERDSQQLGALYGRSGTHLLPMAMQDRLPKDFAHAMQPPSEKYALFVGGTFYANRQGIEWFVEQVAARSPLKTYVVGKGFEAWKVELERNGNVEVIGGVDSLAPWYLGAHVVIAPIFDGSGMKTKVAEALMYGKRIVGTEEAFSGYEAVAGRAGECCQTADQFLDALTREARRPYSPLDLELRSIYEQQYSLEAARMRLIGILCSGAERAG